MTTIRAAAFLVVIAAIGLTVAPVAGTAFAASPVDQTNDTDSEPADNTSMGAEVSEFMQASAADADNEVETRMFDAAYENAHEDRRADVVSERTSHLEQRLESLEDESSELEENRDELNPMVYDARMTRLTVQISALESAVDQTKPRADESGVDADLDQVRTTIGTIATDEITERAGTLIGIELPVDQDAASPGSGEEASEPSDTGEGSDDMGGDVIDGDGSDATDGSDGDAIGGDGDEDGTDDPITTDGESEADDDEGESEE